jgi:cytoskeletal protein CcmA (bactofilin family)
MWKKEDAKTQGVAENSTASVAPQVGTSGGAPVASSTSIPSSTSHRSGASISQGIRIKGEVTGSEDLFIDGVVEGKLNLTNGSLTIGPNGHVKADVNAREVVVRGQIEGKVSGRDKVQLLGTGQIHGEVLTERLAIEEGASLRGKVEAGKLAAKTTEVRAAAAGAGNSAATTEAKTQSIGSGTAN